MRKRILDMKKGWWVVTLCLVLVFSVVGGLATESTRADDGDKWSNPYLVETFIDEEERQIDVVICPLPPPKIKVKAAEIPEPHIAAGTNSLSNVPAFDWCYGCSATSAAMMCGYYDRTGYSNMYAGPTNGGVCPMDNSVWGSGIGGSQGECPLSATHLGKDELMSRGHVDDYWHSYDSSIDPYWGNWAEHGYADCTADFMGTNQYHNWNNPDGSTIFCYYPDGSPLYDYTDCEPTYRDGCHGMRLFAESRGYTVTSNYNQCIYGYGGILAGFTFNDYKAEIDAGRPVLIQVTGHTMLGYGYNDTDNLIYLHDTWDHSCHSMTWGGTYPHGGEELQHYAVTVIQLEPPPMPPPAPSLTSPADGSAVSGTSVTFEWNAVGGATNYAVQVSSDASFSPLFHYNYTYGATSWTYNDFPGDGSVR